MLFLYLLQIGGTHLDVEGIAESFVKAELARLETEVNSFQAQLPPLSTSDEIEFLSALKAALGDDASSNNNNRSDGKCSIWFHQLSMHLPRTVEEGIPWIATLPVFSFNLN
jgi:hypothetical protein